MCSSQGGRVNVTVYRALDVPRTSDAPEAAFALVPGAPFLVDDDSLVVLEGPLLYLKKRFPQISLHRLRYYTKEVDHTLDAAAYDLAHFIQVAEEQVGDWNAVDDAFVLDYCNYLLDAISPRTHQPLKTETVFRRVGRALDYCSWRHSEGLAIKVQHYEVSWYRVELGLRGRHALSRYSETRGARTFGRKRKRQRDMEEFCYILDPSQWGHVQRDIGPLPSERTTEDSRPSRDRLACELSIASGMRADEVAQLTTYQILDLQVDPGTPRHRPIELYITKTKGLKARNVTVPAYLVLELQLYIRTERQDCIKAAQKYWLYGNVKSPKTLFLNGVSANRDAGKPVTADTLSSRFHESVIRCGFVRHVEAFDLDTDGPAKRTLELVVTLFVFHSLRHTYAVWLYWSEQTAGNSEPWKLLQSRLGHADVATTMRTYLRFTEVERRKVNEIVFGATRRRYGGD